mgnify:CR=1 FL=1
MAITLPAAGKHVFLRATSAITTVMLSMTSEDAKEQKAAYGRKKSPAYAGKKTITMERPLSGSPQGESKLRLNGLAHWDQSPLPLGEVGMGLMFEMTISSNSVRVAGGAYQPTGAQSTDLHLHLNTVGKCVSNLETLIGCSALFMANAEILISNSAIIMTGMVMIMMSSGNGATVLRVGATALAAVAMVMAGS